MNEWKLYRQKDGKADLYYITNGKPLNKEDVLIKQKLTYSEAHDLLTKRDFKELFNC